MKHSQIALVWVLGGLMTWTTAVGSAVNSGNSYQTIVDRNVFGLKPPTPPPNPEELNKPKPGTIALTGITTILGNKRALLKVAVPAKPPQPAREDSFILAESQRDGDVEVLAIDEIAGSVKVNNAGEISVLTFDKNGAKPSPVNNAPTPGVIPPPPGLRSIPTRMGRMPPMPGGRSPANSPVPIPVPTAQSPNPANTPDGGATGNTMTPQEAERILEAQRLQYQQQNNMAPPQPGMQQDEPPENQQQGMPGMQQ